MSICTKKNFFIIVVLLSRFCAIIVQFSVFFCKKMRFFYKVPFFAVCLKRRVLPYRAGVQAPARQGGARPSARSQTGGGVYSTPPSKRAGVQAPARRFCAFCAQLFFHGLSATDYNGAAGSRWKSLRNYLDAAAPLW